MNEKLARLAREAAYDLRRSQKYTGRKHVPSYLHGYFQVAAESDPSLKGHRAAFVDLALAELGKAVAG